MVDPTLVVVLIAFALRMLLSPARPVEPKLAVSTQSLENDTTHAASLPPRRHRDAPTFVEIER
jgi:hypothetical protein